VLRRALEINSDDADPWINKGGALFILGRSKEAIACYDRALEIDRNRTSAWNSKGLALDELGRYEEAIACYDRALEINPKSELAREKRNAAQQMCNQLKAAKKPTNHNRQNKGV